MARYFAMQKFELILKNLKYFAVFKEYFADLLHTFLHLK